MGTKLERIAELSKENPNMVFTSIGHLINKELLTDCHRKMDGDKAVGIDGITKEEYGKNLYANLDDLVTRLKRHCRHLACFECITSPFLAATCRRLYYFMGDGTEPQKSRPKVQS